MEYLFQTVVYITNLFITAYWPISYILTWHIAPKVGASISSGILNAFACICGLVVFLSGFQKKKYINPTDKITPDVIVEFTEYYYKLAMRLLILEICLSFLAAVLNFFLYDYNVDGCVEEDEEEEGEWSESEEGEEEGGRR